MPCNEFRGMSSDPKLPFDSSPTGVETRPEMSGDFSSENGSPVDPPRETDKRASSSRPRSALSLWLRRIAVLLFVFLCATLGVMLMIVPWRPEWSENPLLLAYPTLHQVASSGFVRGLVTGLGLLNVWIGFWEALQYHED